MSISDRVRRGIETGSWIRSMFEEGIRLKQQYGADEVFDLSLGNPEMEPPAEFNRQLLQLAQHPVLGMHRYMPNAGYPEARQAVAAQLSLDFGMKFAISDVVMTAGAAPALNLALKAVLDPGDEVLIFAPYFGEYVNYVANHDGVLRVIDTDDTFLPKLDDIEKAISARTRVVLLNSPNNPSGVVYDDDFLSRLGLLLQKKEAEYANRIYLISDEAYRKIIYDGMGYPSPLHHYRRCVIVQSHSKDLALPGERIGCLAVHPDMEQKEELISAYVFCMRALGYVNAPALMQHIVKHLQNVSVDIGTYQRKRDFLYSRLNEMGYVVKKPAGAFYLFPRSPIDDDVAFTRQLQQYMVLTAPGVSFGRPGYFRIAYCVDDKVLEGAMDGFKKAASKFGLL
ncbi:pyridoxal phosphate-dependent aminotransferase [Chloroflexota bacterium]